MMEIYDATLYTGKPDLLADVIAPHKIACASQLWPANDTNKTEPNQEYIESAVASTAAGNGLLSLDIEHWAFDGRISSKALVVENVQRYVQTLSWAKAARPDLKIGYYLIAPIRDYWTPLVGDQIGKTAWYSATDILSPVADLADALFPSLYTFEDNVINWTKYANANISEAKRISSGKPIYAFIWPQFHDSTLLAGQYVSYDFWKYQLYLIQQSGISGAVVWGGYQQAWDSNAGWWLATQDFLNDRKQNTDSSFKQTAINDGGCYSPICCTLPSDVIRVVFDGKDYKYWVRGQEGIAPK